MNLEAISQLKEMGIALVVVVGCWFLIRDILKSVKLTTTETASANKSIFDQLLARMHEQDENYRSFVNDNNHQKTEMIQESVTTMVKVQHVLESHTKVLEKIMDRLERK